MTDERKPAKPGMTEVSAKFVDAVEAVPVPSSSSASMSDDPLIALGEQWKEAYNNWLEADPTGDSDAEIKAQEERKTELGKIAWAIEDQAADIPAQSLAGVLAQLRMAGTHYRLMECYDGKWTGDKYAQITWQAWDGLERLIGTAAAEDPVLALKRTWDAQWQQYESAPADDDKITDPLHDRLRETEFLLHRTPATTIAGVAVKVELWTRSHCPAVETSGRYVEAPDDWWKAPLGEFGNDLDCLPIASALQDLKRMALTTAVAETPPAEDAALFDALAEYDRLVIVSDNLERRKDVFRPGIPEAEEANIAYEAAYDKTMEAWKRARDIPATTQAELFAKLQATVRFMTDLEVDELYETEWSVIKADVQRITGNLETVKE